MPTSESSPIVQPWSVARWPTVTPAPTTTGNPISVCSTALSCTFERGPTTIGSMSPRSELPNQIPASAPSVTRPVTRAVSATQAVTSMAGRTPSRA